MSESDHKDAAKPKADGPIVKVAANERPVAQVPASLRERVRILKASRGQKTYERVE